MKDHYTVLGIPRDAQEDDIRRAFRRRVMEIHPDRNPDPAAHERFVELQAAYECLSDPASRAAYDHRMAGRPPAASARESDTAYEDWVWRQQQAARARYRAQVRKEQEETPLPGWMQVVDKAYNIFFLLVALATICIPVFKYWEELRLPEYEQRPLYFFLVPALAGVIFAGYGYYYWFGSRRERK